MLWLTWRQFRAQTIVATAGLVVLAVLLAVTGPGLAHLYATSGIAGCRAHGDCGRATTAFASEFRGSVSEVLAFVGIAVVYGTPAGIPARPRSPARASLPLPRRAPTRSGSCTSARSSPTSPPAATGPSSGSTPESS